MIEKLKNLPFVTLQEKENLDEIVVEYLEIDNIYVQYFNYSTFEIDNLDNIAGLVEKLFIDKIKELNKYNYIDECVKEGKLIFKIKDFLIEFKEIYDKKIKHLNDSIEDTYNNFSLKSENFKNKYKDKNSLIKTPLDKNDIFFLVPNGFKIEGYDVIETKYLENEIIFGYKSKINDPVVILCTNNDALLNKNDIKLCFVNCGFYPERTYCLLNISNILK